MIVVLAGTTPQVERPGEGESHTTKWSLEEVALAVSNVPIAEGAVPQAGNLSAITGE